MTKVNTLKGLPDCELLTQLAAKAEARKDIDFDFLGTLRAFRRRVSGEVRQINELFPEYTPHDEEYHLKRLFPVADTVLGKDLQEQMNSAELLVLAVGLWGHDWGMAVSEAEKEFILTGKLPEGSSADDFCLLRDESERLLRFARDARLELDEDGRPSQMPIESWREYVRQTHADRSGERVRRFFEPIDGGVADAAARVCLGHWLDLEELEDFRSYPVSFPVIREEANLRALATYVRLVDLLDLAEDRTPYVVWKFVAPRDPKSRMEWAKHRALRPITCSQYQTGRAVQVYGSTNDHEVFAALEDLHLYCDKQLRGCNDLLARMRDPRHYLDLLQLDWTVEARGFVPLSIQFEFDRDQMFEVLSDEIYQGDPYVFLRELLQNSIDAIRMRRAVFRRNGMDAVDMGVIRVTVEHRDGGDAIVTWQDDGIGMDEYVVRNYLAVAGKCYYRSADFEREALEIDPISRFGVGFLSCFMVADRVEVETYRDPYLPPSADPLRVKIADMRRQFRIEKRPKEGADVGTTVRVFVSGKKLRGEGEGSVRPLDVTEYLSVVAGFVEFPIIVSEDGRKTIILHPRRDSPEAQRRFSEELGGECEVHQLDLAYPWGAAVAAQDVPAAQASLQEYTVDVTEDLELKELEGVIAYVAPADTMTDLLYEGAAHSLVVARGTLGDAGVRLRLHPRLVVDAWSLTRKLSRSGMRARLEAVYRGGILVPSAGPDALPGSTKPLRTGTGYLPRPLVVLNLRERSAGLTNLARSELREPSTGWGDSLYDAHVARLCREWVPRLLELDATERYYQMGWLIACHGVVADSLYKAFPAPQWPIALLRAGEGLCVVEMQEVEDDALYLPPTPGLDGFVSELRRMQLSQWVVGKDYEGPLQAWVGDACVVYIRDPHATAAIDGASSISRFVVETLYSDHDIRFLTPPWEGHPPMLQRVLRPRVDLPASDPADVLERALTDPASLDDSEVDELWLQLDEGGLRIPPVVRFPAPFESSFGYGNEVINLRHPVVADILRIGAAARLSMMKASLSAAEIGRLREAFEDISMSLPGRFRAVPEERFVASLVHLWFLARDLTLVADLIGAERLASVPREFVPGTGGDYDSELWPADDDELRPFGKSLSDN